MAESPRVEELRRRVQKDPGSIAFAQLAEEHRRIGNFDEAIRVARSGLAEHPSYLSARVTLGRALMELEQYGDAQRELEQVLRLAPDNLAAIRALAEIHQRRGEFGETTRQFTTTLDYSRSELVLPTVAPPPPPTDFALRLPGVDEFARSLDALDGLTIDVPGADPDPFGDWELGLPGPVVFEEPAPSEAEGPEDPVVRELEGPALRELEGSLAAIHADRGQRA